MVVCNDCRTVVVVVLVSGLAVISGVVRGTIFGVLRGILLAVDVIVIVVGGISEVVVVSPIVDGVIAVTLGLPVFTL